MRRDAMEEPQNPVLAAQAAYVLFGSAEPEIGG